MNNGPTTQDLLLAASVAEEARKMLRQRRPQGLSPEANRAWTEEHSPRFIEEALNEVLYVSSVIRRLLDQKA